MDFDIEGYRLLFAFFCGYFLTVSGSLSQLLTNNSIASPSTLGMDGGAVLFVIISQLLYSYFDLSIDLGHLSFFMLLSCTLLGALFFFRQKKEPGNIWKHVDMQRLILFGLAFNLFIGSIFSIIQFLFMAMNFDFPTGLWFGSLKQYEESYLYIFLPLFILIQTYIVKVSPQLEILNIGRSFAIGIGIDISFVQKATLFTSFILTGAVISYFGVFSFLGLIFPHILRSFKPFKKSMKNELKIGPYITGTVFALADALCYSWSFYGAELPVGMLSSVVGALFLVFLVLKSSFIAK